MRLFWETLRVMREEFGLWMVGLVCLLAAMALWLVVIMVEVGYAATVGAGSDGGAGAVSAAAT